MRKTLLAYFGHHKCATTWINEIIQLVCRDMGLIFSNVHNPSMFDNDLNAFVNTRAVDFLAYTNADMRFVKTLHGFRGFHVTRDPRDIVVSAYFSHLQSHPTHEWTALLAHREKLQAVSKGEGLFMEMDFRKTEFEYLYNWDYDQPNVLELKMEKLIAEPYSQIAEALVFLNVVERGIALSLLRALSAATAASPKTFSLDRLMGRYIRITSHWPQKEAEVPRYTCAGPDGQGRQISIQKLVTHIFNNRFSSKTRGRRQGEENVASHYRKGVSGDWVNHFSAEHRRYFKRHYNDVLIKLGYENSPNW